jgi:hypothetical protein
VSYCSRHRRYLHLKVLELRPRLSVDGLQLQGYPGTPSSRLFQNRHLVLRSGPCLAYRNCPWSKGGLLRSFGCHKADSKCCADHDCPHCSYGSAVVHC